MANTGDVCTDCLMMEYNRDASGADPRWNAEDYASGRGHGFSIGHVQSAHLPTMDVALDSWDSVCETEECSWDEPYFSTEPCGCCGTLIGGDRYPVIYHDR